MRSLRQIADELDQAINALTVLAQATVGPDKAHLAKFELFTEDGSPIDLRAIAADIRRHAKDRE